MDVGYICAPWDQGTARATMWRRTLSDSVCHWGAGDSARGASLQDILRLLTLWFSHGAAPDVAAALEEGFGHVSIDTWLVVIPQVRGGRCCAPRPARHQAAGSAVSDT